MKVSKRHAKNLEKKRAQTGAVPLSQAVERVKGFQSTKFNETVDIAVRTGIDAKQSAQAVRGAFSLPHGIGKTVRVIAFCEGDAAQGAKEAGAIEVGGADLAKKIQDGWMDFDVAIAHPSMMRHVGKLGRVLGPQGKMPSPKSGTVTPDVPRAVAEFAAGKIEFRNDAGGIIHAPMGKRDFATEKLVDNVHAFLEHLKGMRPAASKGTFIRKVHLKTTMSPSVAIAHDSE